MLIERPYRGIVQDLARHSSRRVARQTIRSLQQLNDPGMLLSGEDSGLANVWEEICVQVQHNESIFWEQYDETVRSFVRGHVEKLNDFVQEAIWLQTDEGLEWVGDNPEDREPDPVFVDNIVHYVSQEYVYSEAGRWSNPHIRTYIYGPAG